MAYSAGGTGYQSEFALKRRMVAMVNEFIYIYLNT